MQSIKCEVIQDLLQLYVDDLSSEESNELIDEHLKNCKNCREFLSALREKEPTIDNSDIQIDNSIEKKLMKNIKRRMLLIELICLSIGAIGGLYTTLFVDQFKLVLIYPIIGCIGYLVIKRFWITPVLIFCVTLLGCLVIGKPLDAPILAFISTVLTTMGSIISYALRKIFER